MFIGMPDDNQFSLEISGYQHPGHDSNFFEANWLNVVLTVKSPEYAWCSTQVPALLSSDLSRLIAWLQAFLLGKATNRFLDCEDAMIYFCMEENPDGYTPDLFRLSLHLCLELNPHHDTCKKTVFPVLITRTQLEEWVLELQRTAQQYPVNYVVQSL